MFNGKKILVVDDEADLREILREELIYDGADVIEAQNGINALEILKKSSVDAVLSDMRMPGGDGAVLTRKIREVFGSKPVVILLTGFADLSSEEAYSIGADGYVNKPFHLSELKKTLENLLKGPEQRWRKTVEKVDAQIQFSANFKTAFQSGKLLIGRGGVCLRLTNSSLVLNEIAKVEFENGKYFIGKVVWAKEYSDSEDQTLGLEFQFISDDLFTEMNQNCADWQKLIYYIPRSNYLPST